MTSQTRHLVIGYPLAHSLSPLLHNTIYQQLGINAHLSAYAHPNLDWLLHIIKTFPIPLTAVTMPYKEAILSYLDNCTPEAQTIGAVNTILQRDGLLIGHNTDIAGIHFALENVPLCGKTTLVLGAGGAAQALGYFLQLQKTKICWLNRTIEKAVLLAEKFGGSVISLEKLKNTKIDVIINTTPIGQSPNNTTSPLPDFVFNTQQIVFDMVYNPYQTALLQQAAKHQAKTINGLDMFIGQGLKQIELFIGKTLNTPALIQTARDTLMQHLYNKTYTCDRSSH